MDLKFDFFRSIENKLPPQKGRVLISDPFSIDPYFNHSVVLLTEHNENGSVGFILNKKLKFKLHDIMENFPEFNCQLLLGGPVSTNTVYYIHTLGYTIKKSIKIMDGLFWGGDFKQIISYIELGIIKTDQIQFFLGYSGWSKNQLAREISERYWLVSNISPAEIIGSYEQNLWRQMINKLSDEYKIWKLAPEDPALN